MDTPNTIRAEKEWRRENIVKANASIGLEGLKVSEYAASLQEKYITIQESIELLKRYYGVIK